jgi:Type II secretion system protein B
MVTPSQDGISGKKDEAERPLAKMLSPAESRKPAASTDKKKTGSSVITASRDNTPGAGKITAAYPPAGPVTASPALKLSGIIWHEAPSERCAVINGIIANEGSFIEGAKVVEILPNRVRLSF